jgi:hypothetical protein
VRLWSGEPLAVDGMPQLALAPLIAALRAWSALWTRPQTSRSNAGAPAALRELGRERPGSATALATRACAVWRAAQYGWNGIARSAGLKRAQDLAEQALDLDPAYADAQFVLATIPMTQREETLTEAGLLAAVQADPGHAPALGNLGLLRLRQADFAETLERCDHALASSPQEPRKVRDGRSRHWREDGLGFPRSGP